MATQLRIVETCYLETAMKFAKEYSFSDGTTYVVKDQSDPQDVRYYIESSNPTLQEGETLHAVFVRGVKQK